MQKCADRVTQKSLNPSYNEDKSIRISSKKGHLKIITLLLKDTRIKIDISALKCLRGTFYQITKMYYNYILFKCAASKYYRYINLLLKDNRISLSKAIDYSYPETLNLLINDVRTYPSEDFLNSIDKEIICSSTFAKYLLKYDNIDYNIPFIIDEQRDALFTLLKDIRTNILSYIDKIHFYDIDDDIYLIKFLMEDIRTIIPHNSKSFKKYLHKDVIWSMIFK